MTLSINLLLAAFSGILLALAFPHPSISSLAWAGLIPLFAALNRSDFKYAPVIGLVAGAVFFATVLYWIQIFGYIAWVSLSLALSFAIVLFATGTWLALKRYAGIGRFIVIPSLWVSFEFARSLGPWGFAWAYLGSTVEHPLLVGLASYVGELGLGAIVVLVNVILFSLVDGEGVHQRLRQAALGISVGALVLAPMGLFSLASGAIETRPLSKKPPAMRIAVIQPNLAQDLKADITNNDEIKARYLAMTKEALKSRPDMVIWPESTLITRINNEAAYLAEVGDMLSTTGADLIFGGVEGDGDIIYNSAFYLNADGPLQRYRKIHLVPFGEYMPMRSLVERINSMATLVNDYARGSEHTVFTAARGERFASVICFESSDTRLVGRMVENGARMLFVVTNDAWFGKTAAAEQHFRITRMRAAEYGVPVIQAANTGISGFIAADGTIQGRTKLGESVILTGSAASSKGTTPYAKAGFLFPYICLLVSVVGVVLAVRKGRV